MAGTEDGLDIPQRYWAIGTIGLGLVMAVLDGAIANVALPTIARDVGATPAASIWVVNAYQLAVTVSLLPLASLGDILGYRRVYQAGLVVFTIASLLCARSDSLTTLALARAAQGFGASGIMSVNTALIRFIYPRRQLGTAMGINALLVAVSAAVGPTVASGILSVGRGNTSSTSTCRSVWRRSRSGCGPCRAPAVRRTASMSAAPCSTLPRSAC